MAVLCAHACLTTTIILKGTVSGDSCSAMLQTSKSSLLAAGVTVAILLLFQTALLCRALQTTCGLCARTSVSAFSTRTGQAIKAQPEALGPQQDRTFDLR